MSKLSLEKALERLQSRREDLRERGAEELVELGRGDLLLELAMADDADHFLVGTASALLFPQPAELLVKDLMGVRGPYASLGFRYHLPWANYLYAEELLVTALRPRRSRLAIDAIEGLGLAYFRSASEYFWLYLDRPIDNLADALRARGKRARGGVVQFKKQPDHQTWSGDAWRALCAAQALHRLDSPIGVASAKDLVRAVDSAMEQCAAKNEALQILDWILFELGEFTLSRVLAVGEPILWLPDIVTSLLKMGREEDAAAVLRDQDPVYWASEAFVHWPIYDFADGLGLMPEESLAPRPRTIWYYYRRGRKHGMSPPPWWRWRAP